MTDFNPEAWALQAAKARARALRPWYKKKRFIGLGVIIVIIIIVVAASAGSKKSPPSASDGYKNPAGCTASPPTYPDHQSTDCVALPNNSVSIANTTVTATWSHQTDSFGTTDICAAVTVVNHNSSTISYNDLYWKLQSPSGAVTDTNFSASNDLGSGSLVAGGTVSGNVCFDNPGQSGTYVGIYKPDPFNATRGIWLVPFSG